MCAKAAPELFIAAVEPKVVDRWYNANGYWDGETKRVPICMHFVVSGRAECQTIWVAMKPIKVENSVPSDDLNWFVEGPCSRPSR